MRSRTAHVAPIVVDEDEMLLYASAPSSNHHDASSARGAGEDGEPSGVHTSKTQRAASDNRLVAIRYRRLLAVCAVLSCITVMCAAALVARNAWQQLITSNGTTLASPLSSIFPTPTTPLAVDHSRVMLFSCLFLNRTRERYPGETPMPAVNPDLFRTQIAGYYENVCRQNLRAFIFHDIHPAHVSEYYASFHMQHHALTNRTCEVWFEYVDVAGDKWRRFAAMHVWDFRWLLYADYVLARADEFDYVLMSDMNDVRFDLDPFEFMHDRRLQSGGDMQLFIGRDLHCVICIPFFLERYTACHLQQQHYADVVPYNCGVTGGSIEAMTWVLSHLQTFYLYMVEHYDVYKECLRLGGDMVITNALLMDPTTNSTMATPRPIPFSIYAPPHGSVGNRFIGAFGGSTTPLQSAIRHKTEMVLDPYNWKN